MRSLQVLAVLGVLTVVAAVQGCSQIAEVRRVRAEKRTLDAVARRMKSLERVEGGGSFEVQYQGDALSFPFVFRLSRGGGLEVEAEVSEGPWARLGRVRMVSDARGTYLWAGGGRVEIAPIDSLGPLLRPLLLSAFGGGDVLVHWLVANRCDPQPDARCSGLEISLRMSSQRGSVERWVIRDPVRMVSFTGFVHSWSLGGPFPRVVTGMVHPYEVGISVEYDEVGLTQGAPGGENPVWPGTWESLRGFNRLAGVENVPQ